jgi:NADH dehydrogenase [ubiquinone] 1 alpha subcomplex assembly factor 5
MTNELFDEKIGLLRRARALRRGPELFLHDRALEDILDRLTLVHRRFRSALLIGAPDPAWPDRLRLRADAVQAIEPGDVMEIEPGAFDLCVAIGWLDTVNDLPRALLAARFALREDSLFIGAVPGGDNLPLLRASMRAADEVMGAASPHAHPRIEPAALTQLLAAAGFTMPVVDVDRIQASYRSFADLVRDLRSMGATNILTARSRRPLSRAAVNSAAEQFLAGAEGGRVKETFEILHFAGWTPSSAENG